MNGMSLLMRMKWVNFLSFSYQFLIIFFYPAVDCYKSSSQWSGSQERLICVLVEKCLDFVIPGNKFLRTDRINRSTQIYNIAKWSSVQNLSVWLLKSGHHRVKSL